MHVLVRATNLFLEDNGKLAPGMGFHHDFTGKNTWQTMASLLCPEVGFNKRALCEKLNI
jgi:hypothetical protein